MNFFNVLLVAIGLTAAEHLYKKYWVRPQTSQASPSSGSKDVNYEQQTTKADVIADKVNDPQIPSAQ